MVVATLLLFQGSWGALSPEPISEPFLRDARTAVTSAGAQQVAAKHGFQFFELLDGKSVFIDQRLWDDNPYAIRAALFDAAYLARRRGQSSIPIGALSPACDDAVRSYMLGSSEERVRRLSRYRIFHLGVDVSASLTVTRPNMTQSFSVGSSLPFEVRESPKPTYMSLKDPRAFTPPTHTPVAHYSSLRSTKLGELHQEGTTDRDWKALIEGRWMRDKHSANVAFDRLLLSMRPDWADALADYRTGTLVKNCPAGIRRLLEGRDSQGFAGWVVADFHVTASVGFSFISEPGHQESFFWGLE